jgi:hypothetical protein
MNNSKGENVFEEVNRFPEKVASSVSVLEDGHDMLNFGDGSADQDQILSSDDLEEIAVQDKFLAEVSDIIDEMPIDDPSVAMTDTPFVNNEVPDEAFSKRSVGLSIEELLKDEGEPFEILPDEGVKQSKAPKKERDSSLNFFIVKEKPVVAKPKPKPKKEPVKSVKPDKPPVRPQRKLDLEELAIEVDNLGKSARSRKESLSEKTISDFWKVLGEDDRVLIDGVVREADEAELAMLEPVESFDDEDRASFVEDGGHIVESRPLWDDRDFEIISIAGYKGLTQDSFVDYIRERAETAKVEAAQEKENQKAAHDSYIIDRNESDITIDLERMIDDRDILSAPISEFESELDIYSTIDEILLEEREASPLPVESEDDAVEPMVVLTDDDLVSIDEQNVPEEQIVVEVDAPPLPDDFVLKPIDLSEAEKIAREEILLLSEDDLLDELETIDLSPLEEEDLPKKSDSRSEERRQEPVSLSGKKEMQYVIPDGSQLSGDHKKSIEQDIARNKALIIEEDVREIESALESEIALRQSEEVLDITDRVVILDDAADVERLTDLIPEQKREDMKRLLHYLDGLFEKLPEDVVRNFADSEYFDLYVKIMNELGEK